MTISSAALYGMGKLAVDQYLSEDNEWRSHYNNYVWGSSYFANMANYGGLTTVAQRAGDPWGLLKKSTQKVQGLFNNSAVKVADILNLDTEMTESNQTYEFVLPSVEDSLEVVNGMEQFFKDFAESVGSQDAFLKTLKSSWETIREGE